MAAPALHMLQAAAGAGGAVWAPVGSPFLWIDSDDVADFTFGSGSLVSQWNDKSGNARHFAQSTGSRQPNRNGTQNGRTTVVNDGSDDVLATSSLSMGGSAFTWHLVCPPSSGSQDYLLLHEEAGQVAIISKYNPGSGVKSYELYTTSGGRCTIGSGSETGWHVLTVRRNGTAIDTRIDGTASNSTTVGSATNSAPFILGASSTAGVDSAATSWGTLLVYASYLSDSDCGLNEAGLKTRWGIS